LTSVFSTSNNSPKAPDLNPYVFLPVTSNLPIYRYSKLNPQCQNYCRVKVLSFGSRTLLKRIFKSIPLIGFGLTVTLTVFLVSS
jgi:hypothetical protein